MKTQKQYIRAARTDDRYMPNSQRQGWGRLVGKQTEVIEYIDLDGERVIYRTEAFLDFERRVKNDSGVYETSDCGKVLYARMFTI